MKNFIAQHPHIAIAVLWAVIAAVLIVAVVVASNTNSKEPDIHALAEKACPHGYELVESDFPEDKSASCLDGTAVVHAFDDGDETDQWVEVYSTGDLFALVRGSNWLAIAADGDAEGLQARMGGEVVVK